MEFWNVMRARSYGALWILGEVLSRIHRTPATRLPPSLTSKLIAP